MDSRRKRGDETRERLLNWSEAQKASERLAGLGWYYPGYVVQ